jgi:uncharacterized protein YkwD
MTTRFARHGATFKVTGETLAWATRGRSSARSVVRMWMASASHRAQLLDPTFRRVGVGRAHGQFNGRRGVAVAADLGSLR